MPFGSHMKLTVTNEAEDDLLFYYYVDLELHEELEPGLGRFHAQYRQDRPKGVDETGLANEQFLFGGETVDGKDNYTILEAEGHGHYVGVLYSVYSRRRSDLWDWYGEGDDMIFVDGESWPPKLHGTGTEDYFNTAFGPSTEFCAPYQGITLYSGNKNWPFKGRNSMYRFHIEDPVRFRKSIRVTIEHGHANKLSNDYSSTAYWYQMEPHKPFPALLPVESRLPRPVEPGFGD